MKICLIAGCSHSAGSEIDGSEDSNYNRSNSFGNLLAGKLNRKPINIALTGATNQGIARSILEFFKTHNIDPKDVFVIVGWTDSVRADVAIDWNGNYEKSNLGADWYSKTANDYLRVNMGWPGVFEKEMRIIKNTQDFMATNTTYLEILSANLVLQLQFYFKLHNIEYLMCNTQHVWSDAPQLNFYYELFDTSRYIDYRYNNQCFYWKYKHLGYDNPKAKYGHHNEVPHKLYATELYNFIHQNGLINDLT